MDVDAPQQQQPQPQQQLGSPQDRSAKKKVRRVLQGRGPGAVGAGCSGLRLRPSAMTHWLR
jgi:hypothetical protein